MYPGHVAIIMDGNGRWAKKLGLPRLAGHKAGVKRLQNIVKLTIDFNINYLTLYAFSTENWSRPKSEIEDLMTLLRSFLNKEAKQFLKKNIKMKNKIKIILYTLSILLLSFTNAYSSEIKIDNPPEMRDSRFACKTYFEKLSKSDDLGTFFVYPIFSKECNLFSDIF